MYMNNIYLGLMGVTANKVRAFDLPRRELDGIGFVGNPAKTCLLYTSPSPRDGLLSRMPSSA